MKKGKEDKAEEFLSEKNEERKRAIDAAMGQIEKQFGKGSIMRLGANSRRFLRQYPNPMSP
jgi:recombination protein RecA